MTSPQGTNLAGEARPPVDSRTVLSRAKALRLLFAGFLSLAWALGSTTPAIAQPGRLADLDRLDRYIAVARVDWDVPGLAVGIVKDGALVFSKGYGVRDIADGGPVDEHTLFAIGSNTKGVHLGRPGHAG